MAAPAPVTVAQWIRVRFDFRNLVPATGPQRQAGRRALSPNEEAAYFEHEFDLRAVEKLQAHVRDPAFQSGNYIDRALLYFLEVGPVNRMTGKSKTICPDAGTTTKKRISDMKCVLQKILYDINNDLEPKVKDACQAYKKHTANLMAAAGYARNPGCILPPAQIGYMIPDAPDQPPPDVPADATTLSEASDSGDRRGLKRKLDELEATIEELKGQEKVRAATEKRRAATEKRQAKAREKTIAKMETQLAEYRELVEEESVENFVEAWVEELVDEVVEGEEEE